MATRMEVDLIVKAIAQGFDRVQGELRETGDAAKKAGDEVGRSGKGADKGALGWTELASKVSIAQQAYQTVAAVAGQAYAAVSEGAQLELAEHRFERLSASIGTTSDALLNDLRNATSGMISSAELVTSATDIIGLGLAKNHDDVVRLGRVVGELGLDMQQVIMTFANDSTMRLDALGLSVETVTTRAKELEKAGIAATEAFDMAVLEGLEARLELMGSAAETTAGQIAGLEASWKNFMDEVKKGAAEDVGAALNATGQDAITLGEQATQAGRVVGDYLLPVLNVLSWVALPGLRQGLANTSNELAKMAREEREAAEASAELAEQAAQADRGLKQYAGSAAEAAAETDAEIEKLIRLAHAYENAAAASEEALERGRGMLEFRLGIDPTPVVEPEELNADIQAAIDNAVAQGDFRAAFQLQLEAGAVEISAKGAEGVEAQNRAAGIAELMGLGDAQLQSSAERAARLYYTTVADQATIEARQTKFAEAVVESFDADTYRTMLENKLTGAVPAPEVRPAVDSSEVDVLAEKLSLTQEEIAGVTQRVVSIDDTPVVTLRDRTEEANEQLGMIPANGPYDPEVDSANILAEKLGIVQEINAELGRIPGTYTAHVNINTVQTGGGASTTGAPIPEPRADGGSVFAGQSYLVGERGPEIFMPAQNGSIMPNHAMGGPVNININGVNDPYMAAQALMHELERRGVRVGNFR